MYSFEQILGNNRIVSCLQGFIELDKVPHAVIFSGEKGIGKKTIAKTFAKALLCESKSAALPCGACLPCRTFESGNNADVIYVAPTKASIGADEIRERVVRDAHIRPYSAEHKVYIIDDADKMTPTAQNALLKTLEDSPLYAVFLLLAQNDGLFLPTVLSRCILHRLKKLPDNMVRDYLVNSGTPVGEAEFVSRFAGGNIGRALALVSDAEFVAMRDLAYDISVNIKDYDLIKVFSLSKAFEPFKERIQEAFDIFLVYYRDMLPESRVACDMIEAVNEAKQRIRRYANFQLTIEALLLKLAAGGKGDKEWYR